jgi:hypothetical protein
MKFLQATFRRRILGTLGFLMIAIVTAPAAELRVATISGGVARLNNGSLVNIGQPVVGLLGAGSGGVILSVGMVPVSSAFTNYPPIPQIQQSRIVNGAFEFTFSTQPGQNYVILASTNLADWTIIRSNTAIAFNESFSDQGATNYSRRFFKVQSP